MRDILVQFLGTGDAFGSGGRAQTCIYVDCPDFHFLIDCGASGLSSMRKWGINPSDIDAILISHLHGDHFGGVPFFILDAQLISKRTRPLVIAGPPGLEGRIQAAMDVFFPGSSKVQRKFSTVFIELENETATKIGPLVVKGFQVVHPSGNPSLSIRVEHRNKTITYSGDTEWVNALLKAARGADLFICEAYFYDRKVKFHMDYSSLISHRAELGCRKIVVTHMSDDMLTHTGNIETEAAEDGQKFAI